jgi:iron complex transport system substrate-binding protein
MKPNRAPLLCVLALVLAATAAAGSIERDVTPSGNELDITLTVTDLPVGGIVEALPDSCTWVETDHPADRTRVSGEHVAFVVIGEETIQYRVQGPSEAAEGFAGIWEAYHTLAGASGTVGDDEPQTTESETTESSGLLTAEAETVPCDLDGDGTVTDSELATAILDSLDARYMGGTGEAPSVIDLQDAAFVIEHWDGQALTITDTAEPGKSEGRTRTVTRPLRRIVPYQAYSPEIMQLLDVEPARIVGVPTGGMGGINVLKDPVFFPEYQEKLDVGGVPRSPNYEQIVLAHPDAIILTVGSSSDEIETRLGSMDPSIRFFRFYCYMPEFYADEVQKLGLLLGKEVEADRYFEFRGNVLDTVAEVVGRISTEDRVSVYIESSTGDYKSFGKGSHRDEMIEFAGGRNIITETTGSNSGVDINPEEVIIRNPDVIIKRVGGSYSDSDDDRSSLLETTYRSIMNRPNLGQTKAVRNGRVHLIHGTLDYGAQEFIGTAYLAKLFYPDLFPDLDPRAIHQQYLSEFMRLDYDLNEHPAFVYPT